MQWWSELLRQKKWKQLKKSDWVVLALVGVLLLVIAIPLEGEKEVGETGSGTARKAGVQENVSGTSGDREEVGENFSANTDSSAEEEYVTYLENKLENVLAKMEGVGTVEVMITVSDAGESVIEKDKESTATTTTESDSAGGSRTVSEQNTKEQTIYIENGEETYPYVQKEKLPTVEGVVIVAEGGGNSVVISNISESVEALLPVEAHRIKVVKMCSKEE